MVEFLALWKGLNVAIENKIQNISVYRDSLIIICQMTKARGLISSSSLPMAQRVISFASQFENIEFYHILGHFECGSR